MPVRRMTGILAIISLLDGVLGVQQQLYFAYFVGEAFTKTGEVVVGLFAILFLVLKRMFIFGLSDGLEYAGFGLFHLFPFDFDEFLFGFELFLTEVIDSILLLLQSFFCLFPIVSEWGGVYVIGLVVEKRIVCQRQDGLIDAIAGLEAESHKSFVLLQKLGIEMFT